MTIDIFGNRVDDNVRSEVKRILDIRAQESIIHHDHDSMLMGDCSDLSDVYQPKGWVGGGFDPYQLCLIRAY